MTDTRLHDWRIEEREYRRQEERRGRRHAFETLTAAETALVVVDMVPFFVAESGYCRGIVPNINAIAASRDEDHNATLHTIYRSFGDVRPTDEVIGLIEKRA